MEVAELQAGFKALGRRFDGVPPDYTWERHVYELAEHVGRDDPEHFLAWSTVQATMFVGSARYIEIELRSLRNAKDAALWQQAIEEPWFGDAEPFPPYPRSSGNLIHQAYHIKNWQDTTGLYLADLGNIYEIGGGYGAMAYVARNLGFKGSYTIQDLPEMSLIQRYWLSNVGIDDINLVTDPQDIEADLLVACFSVSELPLQNRMPFEDAVVNSYMLAYQDGFGGIDNIAYFGGFASSKADFLWDGWEVRHLGGRYYLFGLRR